MKHWADLMERDGYWECSGGCGRWGSADDHRLDDDNGRCPNCQEES